MKFSLDHSKFSYVLQYYLKKKFMKVSELNFIYTFFISSSSQLYVFLIQSVVKLKYVNQANV